ncbi:hypothetical protein FSP39_006216 [Pinctada imbricata]|uniref:Uncharacterized protein n=1 Tax=Pinctada imbricata TaxID=66713 RepID=A0AA88YJ58_PINIB|nr:hypothetical protein FSP39_006216 [Pinctada imbricata]
MANKFELNPEDFDLSIETTMSDYPKCFIPDKLKTPTGPKAKTLEFECIDAHMYENPANMVAFRVPANIIYLWIKALHILYYEHYGSDSNLNIHCYDDPKKWQVDGHKAICIETMNKSKSLLYKTTFFITTGTLQAQGAKHDVFARKDFPCLLTLVNAISEHNTNLLGSSENESTNENVDSE